MWLITAVFLTSLGTLNSSVAEDTFFPTHEACRTHYVKHKFDRLCLLWGRQK